MRVVSGGSGIAPQTNKTKGVFFTCNTTLGQAEAMIIGIAINVNMSKQALEKIERPSWPGRSWFLNTGGEGREKFCISMLNPPCSIVVVVVG